MARPLCVEAQPGPPGQPSLNPAYVGRATSNAQRTCGFTHPDALDALGCQREVARVRSIAAEGTSADCQLSTFAKALAQGFPEREALGAVVDWLA